MSTSVLMRLLETSPRRYDKGIRILTLGRDAKIKRLIVDKYISSNHYVLDIGTGTGNLAILCASKGARVLAFDRSERMLNIAREKLDRLGLLDKVDLRVMSVAEMDSLPTETFDVAVSALVFSELSELEREYALKQIYRVLKPYGLLIIEDEVRPRSLFKRMIFYLIRIPLALLTYMISQTTTKPLRGIEEKLIQSGFKIITKKLFLLDSLILLVAGKEGEKN